MCKTIKRGEFAEFGTWVAIYKCRSIERNKIKIPPGPQGGLENAYYKESKGEEIMALTKELIDRFMKVDPAQLGHFVKNGYMNTSIKPVSKDFKMIGSAVTVRMTGDSNIMLYYAVEHAPKGSVIVVDRGGENIHACWR